MVNYQLWEDWEDGNANGWNVINGSFQVGGRSDVGSYAGQISDTSAGSDDRIAVRTLVSGGAQIPAFRFRLEDDGNGNGIGIAFRDSNGTRVCAVGSGNPDPLYTDGSTTNGDGSGSYNYSTYEVLFNWSGNYELNISDAGSRTATLNSTLDVETVELVNMTTTGENIDDLIGPYNSKVVGAWDYLEYDPGVTSPSTPQNLSSSEL